MMPDKTGPLLEAGYSLADIAFGVQLGSLSLAGVELDAARWPKIRAYGEWISRRPAFEKVMSQLG